MTKQVRTNAPTTAGSIPALQRLKLPHVIDFIETFDDDVDDYIEAFEAFEYSFIYWLYKEGLEMEDEDFDHWYFIRELIGALRKDKGIRNYPGMVKNH